MGQEGHKLKPSLSMYTKSMALRDREAYVAYKMESWGLQTSSNQTVLKEKLKKNFIIVETG